MHLTTLQSSLLVAAIYLGFCLLELARTKLFAKAEQSRHDGILEIISTFTLLIATQPLILLTVGLLGAMACAFAGIEAPVLAAALWAILSLTGITVVRRTQRIYQRLP